MTIVSTLVLALAFSWGAEATAVLRDDTAILRRDCPDYTTYSAAKQ